MVCIHLSLLPKYLRVSGINFSILKWKKVQKNRKIKSLFWALKTWKWLFNSIKPFIKHQRPIFRSTNIFQSCPLSKINMQNSKKKSQIFKNFKLTPCRIQNRTIKPILLINLKQPLLVGLPIKLISFKLISILELIHQSFPGSNQSFIFNVSS